MIDYRLGKILIQHHLLTLAELTQALEQQQEYADKLCWKTLGEILLENGSISAQDLLEALDRQAKLREVLFFGIKTHPAIKSKFKRTIDILGAMIGVVVMISLFPAIAIAIYLDSPGPTLFSQPRVGLRGKQFRIWKFRTMLPNADQYKLRVAVKQDYKFFDHRDDPRVTRIGKVLRKNHLDEIPQFLNVLKGEMSLVGTRPPTLEEVRTYSQADWQRLSIKPGITGLWQISDKKYNLTFDEVVNLDMTYIKQWRRRLDLQVIISTVVKVMFGFKNKHNQRLLQN
jgi:lipopolysaccharide/colanic/teichoic acid biosynthesis glycosyltransferase